MKIEMTGDVADAILELQDLIDDNGLNIDDHSWGPWWKALVTVAGHHPKFNVEAHQINRIQAAKEFDTQFNVKGCQTGRVSGVGESNISGISP